MRSNIIQVLYGAMRANEIFIEEFFLNNISIDYDVNALGEDALCKLGDFFVNLLLDTDIDKIIDIIENANDKGELILSSNISQFSDFDDVDKVVDIMIRSGIDHITYKQLGYFLNGKNRSGDAQQKYGENHYKLTEQLGLVSIGDNNRANFLGSAYMRISSSRDKEMLKTKLLLRIPVIQELLIVSKTRRIDITELLLKYLSESTMLRRRSGLRKLLQRLLDTGSPEIRRRFQNIDGR